jgi:Mrp family chromosome partitioning ATPase
VSPLISLFEEAPSPAKQPRVIPIREQVHREPSAASSVHHDQIRALIQQVFFAHESSLVRHVGIATVESSTENAGLCLDVAKALAAQNLYDVGLIDARPDSISLQSRLQIPSPSRIEGSWPIAPRLWIVPRQSWLSNAGECVTEQSVSRLRELTTDFDFSILCCAPVSWLTARIGQACDGMVLVLTANKTRRLVAAQIKEQLNKSQIALLGTVLVERRFPVPQGLYRSL